MNQPVTLGGKAPPAALFRQRNWPRDHLFAAVNSSTRIFYFVVLDDQTLSHSDSCRCFEKFSARHLKKKDGIGNAENEDSLKNFLSGDMTD